MERKLIGRRQFITGLGGAASLAVTGVAFARYDVREILLSSPRADSVASPPAMPAALQPEPGTRHPSLAISITVDPTSSTLIGYAEDTRDRGADLIDSLEISGQGPLSAFLNAVAPDSYAPRNTYVAFRLPATPSIPSRRATKSRPAEPDYSRCQKETFSKERCIEGIKSAHATALADVLADEASAQGTYNEDLQAFHAEFAAARTTAKRQTDELRQIALKASDAGSDITGAFLVAAENMAASNAKFRLLIAQSDLVAFGKQSSGAMNLSGVHVRVINWDARDAATAKGMMEVWAGRFRAAGASSVRFLTPAQTAITDLLEGT